MQDKLWRKDIKKGLKEETPEAKDGEKRQNRILKKRKTKIRLQVSMDGEKSILRETDKYPKINCKVS